MGRTKKLSELSERDSKTLKRMQEKQELWRIILAGVNSGYSDSTIASRLGVTEFLVRRVRRVETERKNRSESEK